VQAIAVSVSSVDSGALGTVCFVHFSPFQLIIRIFAFSFPTAVQNVAVGHDTPDKVPVSNTETFGRSLVHSVPFHRAARTFVSLSVV
jgi:hypothetical protein